MMIRRAQTADIQAIIELIRRRIAWMDERGLDHWNRLDYFDVYPALYFQENISSFLVAEQEGCLIAALALFDHDGLWQDQVSSWYIHNFVADHLYPGSGAALLRFVENLALARGVTRLRMDANLRAHELSDYYEKQGFRCRGLVQAASYLGVKREKFLDRENPPYDAAGFFDLGDSMQEDDFRLILEKTTPYDQKTGYVPAYHFAMVSPEGKKMGICDLRIGHNARLYYGGNIGYQVEEAFRGRHLAARAVRLLLRLAAKHGLGYALITCDPANLASRSTAELAGFVLLEETAVPAWHDLKQTGMDRVCIYGYTMRTD